MYILPNPQEIIRESGEFTFFPETELALEYKCNINNLEAIKLLQQEVKEKIGVKLSITKAFTEKGVQGVFLKKGALPKEHYELTITQDKIVLCGGEDSGLFYGVQTLRQLVRIYGRKIPCVTIRDNPYFTVRGFYHDVTRGKVPTLNTLKELADRAAFYKINQLQLYIEHTFAFKNHSEVWVGADPLNAEEIIELDEYCRKIHIELVPSLSTFGHMYEVMRTHTYHHLCELENDLEEPYSWIGRMSHHTIDVSQEKSLEYVQDMLEQFVPLFSSNKFNICGDETFDLGEGKNKLRAEKLGKGRLYVDFLNKIIGSVKKYNKQVMFWSDVIIKYPEFIDEIPKDVICLNWDYSASPLEKKAEIIYNSGREQYLCPGVSGWNCFMNRMEDSYSNISKMIGIAQKYNAWGILNTDWGDFGHVNLFANSTPGMIYGAALSWNPNETAIDSINKKISRIQYKDCKEVLLKLLTELAKQQCLTFHCVTLWQEENNLQSIEEFSIDEIYIKYNRALEIKEELLQYLAMAEGKNLLDIKEFYVSASGIVLFNSLCLFLKQQELTDLQRKLADKPYELASKLEYWLQDYKRVWLERNKESEFYRIRDKVIKVCKFLRSDS